jgi:hypothetical protein
MKNEIEVILLKLQHETAMITVNGFNHELINQERQKALQAITDLIDKWDTHLLNKIA